MTAILSGPGFERSEDQDFRSVFKKEGGHYNNFEIKHGRGLDVLRSWFPDGEANDMNFVLFSTLGVHGSYTTIEEVEGGLRKYGDEPEFDQESWPDDYHGKEITVLIVQPRICAMRWGNIEVALADLDFLKKLRASSWKVAQTIGAPHPNCP
jgi:hypothetical protein